MSINMNFKADFEGKFKNRQLIYLKSELSFDTKPRSNLLDYEIELNKLSLRVIDNHVVQLSGFCNVAAGIKSNFSVPSSIKGTLKVYTKNEHGFSYSLFKKDQDVFVNSESGWICIGDPNKDGDSVEFIQNCIAVVGEKELLSLWLKYKM